MLVRHLVLPNMTEDTKRVLDWLAAFDKTLPVSLMAQYFPARRDDKFPFLTEGCIPTNTETPWNTFSTWD